MTERLRASSGRKPMFARVHLILLLGVGGLMSTLHALTPANTAIQGFATVDFEVLGVPQSQDSNTVSFNVDELISFSLAQNNGAGQSVGSPQTNVALSFTLTNTGNGPETFVLSHTQSASDDFDAGNVRIYIDADDNGIFESANDTLYVSGSNDPTLAQDGVKNFFIVSDISSGLWTGNEAVLDFVVSSTAGADPAGTLYLGGGLGGVDAVMGSQTGQLSATSKYTVIATSNVTLVKSQSVSDPFGGTSATPGALITYTLILQAAGSGTLSNVVLSDPIPAGTSYEASSISLDGSPLTDSADTDAGVFTGTGIQVTLPTVVAPTTHTVRFGVRVQ